VPLPKVESHTPSLGTVPIEQSRLRFENKVTGRCSSKKELTKEGHKSPTIDQIPLELIKAGG
jgi:hypothetical protein